MARIKKLPKFVKLIKPEKVVKAKFDVKAFAEVAAKAAAQPNELGSYLEHLDEGEGITTYLWQAKKPGYGDWRWSVTVYQHDPATEPSLCEVVMVPGADSLIAPNWVPWAERLADYQALQIELEKQAALDAEEALANTEEEPQEELAVANLEEGEEAKN
jgi:hypothetical protein